MSKSTALANIGTKAVSFANKAKFVAKAKSPEILLGVGIAGFIGTVVMACRATLKASDILDDYEGKVKDAKDVMENASALAELTEEEITNRIEAGEYSKEQVQILKEYDEEGHVKYMRLLKANTALKFVRLYGPSVALGAVSVACILTSRNILNKRYLGAVSAYNALSEVFQKYRARVVDEYGENLDQHFRYGTTYSTVTEKETDENGKTVKKKVDVENIDADETSIVFDESNPNWVENAKFNYMFLRGQQNRANDILHARGHIFLNDVYRMLGINDTPEGAVLGWRVVTGEEEVDFGLFDLENANTRRFVNGQENTVLLNFNHMGIVYDKI